MVKTASERVPKGSRGVSGGLLGASRGPLWASPDLPGALRKPQEVPGEGPGTPLGGHEAPKDRLLFSGEVFLSVAELLKNSWFYHHFLIGTVAPFAVFLRCPPPGPPRGVLGLSREAARRGLGLSSDLQGSSELLPRVRPGPVALPCSPFSAFWRLWALRGVPLGAPMLKT